MTVGYKDTVRINHPELSGTGIITRFHNDKFDGVEVEIIEATRKSNGKSIKAGQKFNCLQKYLETTDKYIPGPPQEYPIDNAMKELFESEEAREEAIGVVTPEFTGRWS